MGRVAKRLLDAGFLLPESPDAVGRYLPAVLADRAVHTAGQIPFKNGTLITTGTVPDVVSVDLATDCAAQCALNALAAASTVCDLDEVERVIKLVGYVSSAADFTEQSSVINGASEVLLAAFGDPGRHAREAVGVTALPLGAPVEVSLLLTLRSTP